MASRSVDDVDAELRHVAELNREVDPESVARVEALDRIDRLLDERLAMTNGQVNERT